MFLLLSPKEQGVITTQLIDLSTHVIPRIFRIHSRMKLGDKLSDRDISFLRDNFNKISHCLPSLHRDADYQQVYTSWILMLREITDMALENETNNKPS